MHWVLTVYLAAEEKVEGNPEAVLTGSFEAWTKSRGQKLDGFVGRAPGKEVAKDRHKTLLTFSFCQKVIEKDSTYLVDDRRW